ncbi:MAG: hypothetical protein HOV80_20650, partial [Polyangiaceae bacterium]|nr:hypothetical protein [Polyangiaceae bacterium]
MGRYPYGLLLGLTCLVGCGDDGGGGTGGDGNSTTTATTAPTTASSTATGMTEDLSGLSDTFDGSALDSSWTIFNEAAVDASVGESALSLELTQAALWFQASQGVLVHKTVTGDFRVTANVRAHKTSMPAEPPTNNIHLGGLMARDP